MTTKTITKYRPGIYAEIFARQSARAERAERNERIITAVADTLLALLALGWLVGVAWFGLQLFCA